MMLSDQRSPDLSTGVIELLPFSKHLEIVINEPIKIFEIRRIGAFYTSIPLEQSGEEIITFTLESVTSLSEGEQSEFFVESMK